MPGKAADLELQELLPKTSGSPAQDTHPPDFFQVYSAVPAFNKKLTRPNQAVVLFSESKVQLEREMKTLEGEDANRTIAIHHSLLALIHWLYPNYEKYDRTKNAAAMYYHAKEATRLSDTPFSESYVLGLFIQLRVLPFLIMTKRPFEKQLSKAQGRAQLLLLTLDSLSPEGKNVMEKGVKRSNLDARQIDRFRGLLHEALGFSYWQLKRDSQNALKHLEKSVSMLLGKAEFSRPPSQSKGDFFSGSPSSSTTASSQNRDHARAFYDAFASIAFWDLGHLHEGLSEEREGDESIRLVKEAKADYERSYALAKRTRWDNYKGLSAYMTASIYEIESRQETDKGRIVQMLRKAISAGEDAMHWLSRWSTYDSDFLAGSWIAAYYSKLAGYSEPVAKRRYMRQALKLSDRAELLLTTHDSTSSGKLLSTSRIGDIYLSKSAYYRQFAIDEKLSDRTSPSRAKSFAVDSLKKSLDYALRSKECHKDDRSGKKILEACKLAFNACYELLRAGGSEAEDRGRLLTLGGRTCQDAAAVSRKKNWNESVAEASWNAALISDFQGEYSESSKCYHKAYEYYERAKSSYEHGGKVYQNYTDYMLACNKIELAKLAHATSEFEKAAELYSRAAVLLSKTKDWSGVSPLYLAESLIEKGEEKSLQEEENAAEGAIAFFEEAISNLIKVSEGESKVSEQPQQLDPSSLAKQLTAFCRARIILEKSKEAYRVGDLERAIAGLSSAESMFDELAAHPVISDPILSNELHSMASLCKALGTFQKAQLKGDNELYLEARKIFGRAAEESKSKTLRPLLAGLASFASFLFYSNQVEESLDTKVDFQQLDECNKALQNAESNFRKLGNRSSFLNMLKASKHILDATIKMSAAEREVERVEVKAKLYAEAQRSLSLASKYYKVMGSSKRLKEALKMISAVRSHQRLIPLAHDIIAEVASSQIIYAAIASSPVMEQTPYSPSSSGASYVSLDCDIEKAYSQAGVKSKISFSVSNLGRDSITLMRIDEVIPDGFAVADCPTGTLSGPTLKLNLRLEAGATRSFSLTYEPREAGEFNWHPSLIFLDAGRNFKLARSRAARAIVEANDQEDYAALLESKAQLESELVSLRAKNAELEEKAGSDPQVAAAQSRLQEEIYAVKEKASRIEEKFLRTKNEYQSLISEQEKVRFDIDSIAKRSARSSEVEESDEYTSLKAEDKVLEARIQRRRTLLEQARLL